MGTTSQGTTEKNKTTPKFQKASHREAEWLAQKRLSLRRIKTKLKAAHPTVQGLKVLPADCDVNIFLVLCMRRKS